MTYTKDILPYRWMLPGKNLEPAKLNFRRIRITIITISGSNVEDVARYIVKYLLKENGLKIKKL